MQEVDADFLNDIWNFVKEYIPVKEKETAAYRLVDIFEDFGLEIEDLYRLEGEDKYLDKVIKSKHQEYDVEDDDFEDFDG